MKKIKLGILLSAILSFIFGCAAMEISNQFDSIKMTGRHVGYEIENKHPGSGFEILGLSKAILVNPNPDIVRIVIDRLIVVLIAKEVANPLLAADIQEIATLIRIEKGIEPTDKHIRAIKSVAEGLISGIEIAQKSR